MRNFLISLGVVSRGRPELAPFGEALLACHSSIYRYARALARDPSVAEELVQEAYRRALSARQQPVPPTEENVRPWLFTIVRNHWYNDLRRQRTVDAHENAPGAEPADADTPHTILSRRLLQSEVRDAVEALPETLREVIVLREIESMTYAEIARLLECPPGTVMSRLARARAALRIALGHHAAPARGVGR